MHFLILNNLTLMLAAVISFAFCLVIIKTKDLHRKFTTDSAQGPQKFHFGATPRVGGLAVFVSLAICELVFLNKPIYNLLLLASLPIFLVGFLEDILKNISSSIRFFMALISGIIFIYLTGLQLKNSGIAIIDNIFISPYVWACLSVVCIAALVNGMNMIDGFNGLASGSSSIMASGLLFLALDQGLFDLSVFLAIFISAQVGFFILNFPKGLIFMGDCGAYLSGFVLVTSAIILTSQSIYLSPLILVVIFAYPIVEVLFSTIRKSIIKGHRPDKPDSLHLHMLVHRSFSHLAPKFGVNKNAMTSIIMLLFPLSGLFFVSLFNNEELYVTIYFVLFLYVYLSLYRYIFLRLPTT